MSGMSSITLIVFVGDLTLSRLIIQLYNENLMDGIKVTRYFFLTYLLFVDDILIFSIGEVEEWSRR